MKRVEFLVLLGIFILFMSFCSVRADVIFPGEHAVTYSFGIENLNDFPDYTFFYAICRTPSSNCNLTMIYWRNEEFLSDPIRTTKIIESNEPKFYKFTSAGIFAIKNNLYNESLNFSNPVIKENTLDLNYSFKSLIKYVKDSDPLVQVKDVFKIVQDTNGFKLERQKVVYYYSDGSSEEKTANEVNIPGPSKKLTIPFILFYWIVPAIALILMILWLLGGINEE